MRSLYRAAVFCLAIVFVSGCSSSSAPLSTASSSLRTYDSFDELSNALGFEMIQIGGGGFEPYSYATIEDVIGQIEYRSGDSVLLLRMAKDDERDITGVGQVTYTTTDHGGSQLHIGNFKDILAAWITSGGYTYALSATDMDLDNFQTIASQLADVVTAA